MQKATVYLGTILAGLMMVACGTDSTNSPGNPSSDAARIERNDGLNSAVRASCDRYVACNQVGEHQKFTSRQDCEIKLRDDFNKKWNEAECGGSHAFIKAKFEECVQRNATWNCEGNLLDKLGFETECSSTKVCAPK